MSSEHIFIDFETRSTVDLKKTTADVYAHDPTTDVWCAAYALGENPIRIWTPQDEAPPTTLFTAIEQGALVYAHNAAFELAIWNAIMVPRYGWPELPLEQVRCTMAMAYAMSLPGSLDGAAAALGIDTRKDMKGHRLMLKMARPRKYKDENAAQEARLLQGLAAEARREGDSETAENYVKQARAQLAEGIIWWDDDEHQQKLQAYCAQDVEVERDLSHRLADLPEIEWQTWRLDYRINQAGVPIDTDAVHAAMRVVESEKARLDEQMAAVTKGTVKACTWVNVLTDWLRYRGIDTPGVAKADLRALLTRDDLPDDVRQALELRQEAAKSSTAKLTKMVSCSRDGRVRGSHQYHGAATGRWSGRHVQFQNVSRGNLKPHEVVDAIELMNSGDVELLRACYGRPMDAVSSCLRGMVAAPEGKELIAADFSNIEGRVLAWLAGQEDKLDAFRAQDDGSGPEIYEIAYAQSFGISADNVNKEQRQIGKTQELALGFFGGVGAFETMAGAFGIDMGARHDEVVAAAPGWAVEKARDAFDQRGRDSGIAKPRWVASEIVKLLWRSANPQIVQYWRDLQDAAIEAVDSPGRITKAGARPTRFRMAGSFLWAQLPSKRVLCYPYPELQEEQTPWGSTQMKLSYMEVNGLTRKWERTSTHGGKLAENCLAGDTEVLTEKGWQRLDAIPRGLRVWDGVEWVDHSGLKEQPKQLTLLLRGVRMTPDHQVLTNRGWVRASQSKRHDRFPCWLPDGQVLCGQQRKKELVDGEVRLRYREEDRSLRAEKNAHPRSSSFLRLFHEKNHIRKENPARDDTACRLRGMADYARPLREALARGMAQLWRSGYYRVRTMAAVIRGFLGGHGTVLPTGADAGTIRQRFGLSPGQLLLGVSGGTGQQSANQPAHRHPVGRIDGFPSGEEIRYRCHDSALPTGPGGYWGKLFTQPDVRNRFTIS